MKYSDSLEVALPREEVVRLISDPGLLPMWLRGLVRHQPVTGEHGQVGTVSRAVLRTGGQEMECTETVTRREPADLSGIPAGTVVRFEREILAPGMWSATRDRFLEAGPGRTRWESENEFRFDGLLMRLLAPLLRSAFRKQSRRHMEDFRAFAEQGIDVRTTEG